ncbi:MAG: hypothetical protein WC277_10230, partial [Bacilli bacterium]
MAPIAAAYDGFAAGQDVLRYNTAIDQLKEKEAAFQQEYTKWKPVYDQYVKAVEEYQTSPLHQQTNSPQAQQALRQKYDALKQYETRLAPLFQSADAFEQQQQTLETLQAKDYNPITAGIIDALGAARTGATPPASRRLTPIYTEQAVTYGAYPALAGAAEWYTTKVKDPFRQGATAIVEEAAPAPIRGLALRGTKFATGLVGVPADLAVQAGMAIPGAEVAARSFWDHPVETPPYLVAGGLAYMGAGLVEGLQKEPEETLGSLAGTVLLTKGAGKGYTRVVKPAVLRVGEASGVVRKQTYGYGTKPKTDPVQYMSRGENLETILENPTINLVRATSAPVGSFVRDGGLVPVRKMRVRNPGEGGRDVPAGQDVGAKGVFGAISRPGLIEPYGTWFTRGGTQGGGLKGKVLGSRVYLHENVRTVQVPKALKDRIYQRVRETGEFWGKDYDAVLELAKEQSKRYGEPVAVPSPKRAIGDLKPENEAFMVFGDDVSRVITGTRFAGLSSEGTIVKRITVGQQAPITQTRLGSIGENLRYNWDLGRDGLRIYNRRYLEAQTKDMARKKAELYEGALSYPGEYAGHGVGHAQGVQSGLMWQRSVSPTLQQAATPSEMWMRAKYHDIAKIGDADTQPYPHGWAAGTAIKKGMIQDPDLLALPKETQMAIGRDIQLHTDIQPTLRSQIRYRPSATAKALATADRLDLTRFGVPVKSSKLFPVPEETLGFKVGQVADRLPIGFQVRFVGAPAPLSGGAAATAKSSSGNTRSRAPARTSTPAPASAAPKDGEMLDYPYPNSGKPAAKPTLIPPAKEYGGRARPYEEPYAAPYGEKYPLYGGPYATPYGTQYPEPAPPYPAPYSEPYPAAPHPPPYPDPYVAPP